MLDNGPNNAPLFARRDLSRQYAELIDIPVADEHLDCGQHFLTAAQSVSLLESQAFKLMLKLDGRRIVIISHVTRPPHNAGRQLLLQPWQRLGAPLA